ncbi:MAG: RDD family protein [Methanomicrobiales archaeon]|nr:RDD family protein [Methanomicrobiales archaeon]
MVDTPSPSGDTPPPSGHEHIPPPCETGPASDPATGAHPPAGFWVRLGAAIIDGIPLLALSLLVLLPLQPLFLQAIQGFPGPGASLDVASLQAFAASLVTLFLLWILLVLLVTWLYFSYFESSPWQGTPGKLAFGLGVTDLCGGRLSFLRAGARCLSKGVSLLCLGIGFLIIGFTDGKHGLHDMIAGTRVTYSSADLKGSKWHRILIAGSILLPFLVAGMMILFAVSAIPMFPVSGTVAQHPLNGEPLVAARATQLGSSIFVTWQGGRDNSGVKGYRVMLGDPLVSYPESGELYPPETGNMTEFGTGKGGPVPVVVVVTMKDGRIRIILDTEVETSVNTSPTPLSPVIAEETTVSPTPAATLPPLAMLLPLGQSFAMDDNFGKQVVSVSVESQEQKETLYYPSGNYTPQLYTKTAIPGHRFVLVGVEIQLVGLHGEGLRTYFMTPRADSFTLCEGEFCVNVTDPDEFGTGANNYIKDRGSLYRAKLIDKENHGDGLLVFETPDHLQLANATVRFCPRNDPLSAGWPRCDDNWDCEQATIGWRLR